MMMKMDWTLLLVSSLLFLATCNNPMDEIWLVPTSEPETTTSEQLIENGYKMVRGVDVLLYEKTIADTVYGYQLGTNENSADENGVAFQYWRILRSFNSPEEISGFLADHNLHVVVEDDSSSRFVVVSGSNNSIFVCDLLDDNYLNIVYYHPSISN